MARTKLTTKKLAQRIDLSYFKRPHPFRRLRLILSVAAPLAAILWLGWYAFARDNHVYSGGRVSTAHAILSTECNACHVKQAGSFSAKASNQGCESCHDGPIHHADQLFTPNCANCHEEHRGHSLLAATSNISCTQCHANLHTAGAATHFAQSVTHFDGDHPEFAALRLGSGDPGTIKFNHAVHLKHNLRGPSGLVDLDCRDCHRPAVANSALKYGAPAGPETGSAPLSAYQPAIAEKSLPPSMDYRRAYMSPIAYAKHCVACHGLQFDPHFQESAPHDTPEVIHAFLMKKFQGYIPSHLSELRVAAPVPERDLPQKPLPIAFRILSQQQWVDLKVAESEQLLWRKTCAQCHALSFVKQSPLPLVAYSNITKRWFQHAVFDHDTHKLLKCVECHSQATTSRDTSDVLIPGIKTCQTCHHAGSNSAESRCFECHTYHNWANAKEVRGSFVLSRLGRGN
ncbi:MAG: hypothetical protein ABSD87_01865 [Candidatus Acidiferrales bacterium]